MKKINLPKLLLGVFVTTSLTVLSITLAHAYGETGCQTNGLLVGVCAKTTEGTYACEYIGNMAGLDCSGS